MRTVIVAFTQEQATATILFCAVHPCMEHISGLYMYECCPVEPSYEAQDRSTAAALWELCEQIVTDKVVST